MCYQQAQYKDIGHGSGSTCRGFTLIELLVSIGIMGVLAGMIMPAAHLAKEQAKKIACLSNLRQLGIGLQLYSDDNNGWFPVEDKCGNPQNRLVTSLVPSYIANMGAFYCPSADSLEKYAQSDEYGGPGGDSIIDTPENRQRYFITYKYFSMMRRDTRMPLPLKLSEYPHLLRNDETGKRWLMSDYVRKDVPVFPHREKGGWGGGRNVLFIDISMQFVRHRTPNAFSGN